jgi:two-component system, NarL family, invasion response regulator UvrY
VKPIKILVVDDSSMLREHIVHLLHRHFAQATIGEASHGEEAIGLASRGAWDVMVLDISMPGVSGLVVLDTVRREQPGLAVVMLSIHISVASVENCLRRGAHGYVAKEDAPEELVPAIESALQGQLYRSRRVRESDSVYRKRD